MKTKIVPHSKEAAVARQVAPREARRATALVADSRACGWPGASTPKRQNELNQRFRSDWAASTTRSRACAAHGRVRRWRYAKASRCCLTFELRGRNRRGAWPARRMMDHNASRAKCHAGGGPAPVKG